MDVETTVIVDPRLSVDVIVDTVGGMEVVLVVDVLEGVEDDVVEVVELVEEGRLELLVDEVVDGIEEDEVVISELLLLVLIMEEEDDESVVGTGVGLLSALELVETDSEELVVGDGA